MTTFSNAFASRPVPRQYVPIQLRPRFEFSGPELRVDYGASLLGLAQRAGLPILPGTDGYPWGFKLHDELATFVDRGMTPAGALQAATLSPAKAYRATDSLGTVAAGKLADLVLLRDNPLYDIHNTTHILGVVADGRYYDPVALHQLLVEAERLAQRCPVSGATGVPFRADTAGKFCITR